MSNRMVQVMVTLSFSVFEEKLKKRKKMQTLRPRNEKRVEQMKRLGIQIYWKQRTKEGYKMYDAELEKTWKVAFLFHPDRVDFGFWDNHLSKWVTYTPYIRNVIAELDGFINFAEMYTWFKDNHQNLQEMEFDLIRWREKF